MKLINIKSLHPENEFAPSWNIPIHLSTWGEHEKVNKIKNFLIDKESEVLDQPVGDGTAYGDGRISSSVEQIMSKGTHYLILIKN